MRVHPTFFDLATPAAYVPLCYWQFDVKKHMVYGAIGVIWIVMPVYLATISTMSSDIVDGTCIPWGVYSSYAAEKAIILSVSIITYLLPMTLMIFCYSTIVYSLTHTHTQAFYCSSEICPGPPG